MGKGKSKGEGKGKGPGAGTGVGLGVGLLLLAAQSVAGQALTGRVFDGASGQAVGDAEVAVLGDSVAPVGLAVSDSTGAFHVALEEPGVYRIVATAVGYDSLAVDSIRVGEAEDVWVELRLGPRPFDVEGLTVVARRPTGPPPLRAFYRRLDRYEKYGGSGVVLDREALDRHIAQSGASALARESIHAREVFGLGGGLIVRRRGARFGQSPWCTPAFFLDGNRVDGQTVRSIPASDLLGIELYRGLGEVPAQFMGAPGATRCGVVLAWSRRGSGRPLGGELRPFQVGAFLAGVTSDRADGALDLAALGFEVERGIARSMVGWIQLGLTQPANEWICEPFPGASCDSGEGLPWLVMAGGSLFPTGSELPVAPYIGAGLGLASPGKGVEATHVLRAGLELIPGPVHVRVELRTGPDGWGAGVGVMF
jgi:hypothetical protein